MVVMRVGNGFICRNHTQQQLAENAVRFQFIQEMIVSSNAAIHLSHQDAASLRGHR